MTSPPPPELKERLRSEGFTRRDGLDKEFRHEAAQRIAAQAFKFSDLQDVTPVGGYWPIRTEVAVYPDSKKVGAMAIGADGQLWVRALHHESSQKGYFDGEPVD